MPDDTVRDFSAMLRGALGDALAPDAASFLDMFAEDGVMEFPFAPPGMAKRLDGRAALAAHLESLGKMITFDGMGSPVVHRTQDPGVVILEFQGFGHGVESGAPYRQTYISVITVADGRIVRYRDYWNPLVVLGTMGARRFAGATDGGAADA